VTARRSRKWDERRYSEERATHSLISAIDPNPNNEEHLTVPLKNEANVRHLLRRTEFIDRQSRVEELMGLDTFADIVDNIIGTSANPLPNPPSLVFQNTGEDDNWRRGQELAHFWFDQMANDSQQPMQEKMALFWHGHLVSEIGKVGSAALMREQIDLYRRNGLDNFRDMVKLMSTQVAMLRYLDNNRNEADSPNQNFARELMELFLLEVGNYTEADVEAATAAWTGHSDDWQTDAYVWLDDLEKQPWTPIYHDSSIKQFLGQTINDVGDPRGHGDETIDVILGNGVVPPGADKVSNRGRATRLVAAEFLSRKLWVDFANQSPPAAVIEAMRDAFDEADFDIRPWVRTMLLRDEFYTDEVVTGLVRSPIDWIASMLYALDLPSADATPTWLLGNTGQEILRPPNVSGWKINGYYVNASAMEARARIAQGFAWTAHRNYWDDGGYLQFRHGQLTRNELIDASPWPDYIPTMSDEQVVDNMSNLMEVTLTSSTRQQLIDHLAAGGRWERNDLVFLMLLAPELHVA
jgi:uncharacterized protein (DUF1800 family)